MLRERTRSKKSDESSDEDDIFLSFTSFILPTFRTSFRRRRALEESSSSPPPTTPEASSPASSDIPSLSSSPTSSPASPTFPPSANRLSRVRPTTLRCKTCSTDLAFHDQIISKSFTGRWGRGYLVAPPSTLPTPSCPRLPPGCARDDEKVATVLARLPDLVNTALGKDEQRQLTTGRHAVANVSCAGCGTMVGWKYTDARNPEQQYKIGKFILETSRVVRFHSWEDVPSKADQQHDEGHADLWDIERAEKDAGDALLLEFDSEDEDECDEMFAGTWDPKNVAMSRLQKRAQGGYVL